MIAGQRNSRTSDYPENNVAVLPYDTAIDEHLRPGEQLRWVGRARQGWRYRWSNRILILQVAAAFFSLIWLICWVRDASAKYASFMICAAMVVSDAIKTGPT